MNKGFVFITNGNDYVAFFQRTDSDNLLDLIRQIPKHKNIANLYQSTMTDLHSISYVAFALQAYNILEQQRSLYYQNKLYPTLLIFTTVNLENFHKFMKSQDINIYLDISASHKNTWLLKYNFGEFAKEYEETIILEGD